MADPQLHYIVRLLNRHGAQIASADAFSDSDVEAVVAALLSGTLDIEHRIEIERLCPSCHKTGAECEDEKNAIAEQNERGCCEFGPDCDGTLCGVRDD